MAVRLEDRLGLRAFVAEYTLFTIHAKYKTLLEKRLKMFPGYVFCSEPDNWRSVKQLDGVISALPIDGEPESLPSGIVEKLIRSCERGEFNVRRTKKERIKPQSLVRPLSGPLCHEEGLVLSNIGANALWVMFKSLPKSIKVPVDLVEVVG